MARNKPQVHRVALGWAHRPACRVQRRAGYWVAEDATLGCSPDERVAHIRKTATKLLHWLAGWLISSIDRSPRDSSDLAACPRPPRAGGESLKSTQRPRSLILDRHMA